MLLLRAVCCDATCPYTTHACRNRTYAAPRCNLTLHGVALRGVAWRGARQDYSPEHQELAEHVQRPARGEKSTAKPVGSDNY